MLADRASHSHEGERMATIGGGREMVHDGRTLPNGWVVSEISRSETDYLYSEIVEDAVYYSSQIDVRGGVVVDVGANIGLFSLYACQTWPVRRLIAIEAIPDVRSVLRRNLNHLPEAVVPDVAAGATEGLCHFAYYPRYSMMSGRHADPAEDFALVRQYGEQKLGQGADADVMTHLDELLRPRFHAESRQVNVLPLATICAQAGVSCIDLLKVDVEGDELSVLDGLGDVSVRHAIVEVDGRRCSPDAVRSALDARGLAVRSVAAPGYENLPLSYFFAHER
jgi:FkbM family methyltransferase